MTEKLKIVRVVNHEYIPRLKEFFTLPDPDLKDVLVTELMGALQNVPDSILILLGLDESEEIKVLLIATNPGPMFRHINVTQLWADPDTDPSWQKSFMPRLIMWAVALDKTYLRGETARNADAMFRRFGFEHWATIVKFDLIKSGHFEQLTQKPEEVLSWETFSPPAPQLSLVSAGPSSKSKTV